MLTDHDATEPTRADGLWFQDCGLIIQAETTLFRVSRDFLGMRSCVFRDMLSMPPPADADTMEGCPFVRLPDSAQDITYFLKALLYSEFFEPFPAQTTFPIIAGVLRMSHKYEVDALRKRALIHLGSMHPTTFDEWETKSPHVSWHVSRSLDIILLARRTSALWILPAAFYRACQFASVDEIINGDEDSELHPADKVACVTGVRTLETTSVSDVLQFLYMPRQIFGCQSPAKCEEVRTAAHFDAEDWRAYEAEDTFLPFDIWGNVHDWSRLSSCCATCVSSMRTTHWEAKLAVWDQLPQIFRLPNWKQLNEMKAEALR
ncbi:hypothetical protein B0H19DRAFT_936860 [Mycena capillaripes]|nr:hypothetical protein B0H19DRAFT_936860 [Mycena capillaripes]